MAAGLAWKSTSTYLQASLPTRVWDVNIDGSQRRSKESGAVCMEWRPQSLINGRKKAVSRGAESPLTLWLLQRRRCKLATKLGPHDRTTL